MKKIIAIVALIATTFSVSSAQKTYPRYGTAPNQNRTYAPMTLNASAIADVASATCDTIYITPTAFETNYTLTLSDSVVIAVKSTGGCYLYDRINFIIQNTAGANHKVYFTGTASYNSGASYWGMTSTGISISPAASKSANLSFLFDGALWLERLRAIR